MIKFNNKTIATNVEICWLGVINEDLYLYINFGTHSHLQLESETEGDLYLLGNNIHHQNSKSYFKESYKETKTWFLISQFA